MVNFKKHTIKRLLFILVLLLLAVLQCYVTGNKKETFVFAQITCFENNYLVIVVCYFLIGLLDLVILAFKKCFTWGKLLVFLVIQALLVLGIYILDNINF